MIYFPPSPLTHSPGHHGAPSKRCRWSFPEEAGWLRHEGLIKLKYSNLQGPPLAFHGGWDPTAAPSLGLEQPGVAENVPAHGNSLEQDGL